MTMPSKRAVAALLLLISATCFGADAPAQTKEQLDANVRHITARAPGSPFFGYHFMSITPGITTRDQLIEQFGEPTTSMNMGPAGMFDEWIVGSQVVAAICKDGIFAQLQTIAGVNISSKERRRLGL